MSTPTDDTIRAEVARSYGSRRTQIIETDTLEMIAPAADACCGGDCCSTAPAGEDFLAGLEDEIVENVARLYADETVTDLASAVRDVAYGSENPAAIAALKPGEAVLAIGSGSGIDSFLAAKMVGSAGRVYGVDTAPEAVERARANAVKVGAPNVEFQLTEGGRLPLDDSAVDVIFSNSLGDLSSDRAHAFSEAFRVLRPGGRLHVADAVWTEEPPAGVREEMEQWAGRTGALLESEHAAQVAAAGFERVTSAATPYPNGGGLASADVTAYKPL